MNAAALPQRDRSPKGPAYAGTYAYGKGEKRIAVIGGRARKIYGHGKPLEARDVLIKDHHDGYIDRAEFERNQATLAAITVAGPAVRSPAAADGPCLRTC